MTRKRFLAMAVMLGFGLTAITSADEPATPRHTGAATFTVHEWGTFTTLQDDKGLEMPGINIDDEPVPEFVHNLAPYLLNNPILANDHWLYRKKGAPQQHPQVTMRLETPVIYFYPGKNGSLPKSVDVDVAFRGGWLTEFYPYAKADLPGLQTEDFDFGPLTPSTIGRLLWKNVQLDTHKEGPQTDAPVWLAPRKVNSVDISVTGVKEGKDQKEQAEHERYLFYRGVANQPAPLRVMTSKDRSEISIRANFQDVAGKENFQIAGAWLLDIRADGTSAYREVAPFTVSSDTDKVFATASRRFSTGDYAKDNLTRAKSDMHRALVKDGLFEDEATAMLNTWDRAYFRSPGMRLMFLVPEAWTNRYLPLSITGRPEVDRVMIGRIELVTDEQLKLLDKVSEGPFDVKWMTQIKEGPAKAHFLAGRSDFGDLGVAIPANYKAYLALGRFRNALILAEAKRQESAKLEQFVKAYEIRPYGWTK